MNIGGEGVRKFLDRFRRKQPEEQVLALDYAEIPQWRDRQEIEVRTEMSGQTEKQRAAIGRAVEDAKSKVNRLLKVEIDDQTPPKLRRVVETSLQPFVRAMDITLSRHLSADPIEFYNDAAEVLKGCVKHMNGQGKYLAAALPEEMKDIRSSISIMGLEINNMTREIARAERTMGRIREIGTAHHALDEAVREYGAKHERWELIWKEISKDEARLKTITEKIAEVESDEGYRSAEALKARASALEEEKQGLEERYHTLVSTAGGVLRRAAHAAERQGDSGLAHRIQKVMQLLDRPVEEECEMLARSFAAMLPEIRAMIEQNTIVLKNKDELRLFSGDHGPSGELEEICGRHAAVRGEIDALQVSIARSEPLAVMDDLEQRRENIQAKHRGDLDRMTAYEREMEAIKAEIPPLREALLGRIEAFAGETTRVELRGVPGAGDEPAPGA